MTELSFDAGLYDAAALAAAAQAYGKFASCTVEPGAECFRVQISATGAIAEERIVNEFCNYALGATIERKPSFDGAARR